MTKRRHDYDWARAALQTFLAISKAKVKADFPLMVGAWSNGVIVWVRML